MSDGGYKRTKDALPSNLFNIQCQMYDFTFSVMNSTFKKNVCLFYVHFTCGNPYSLLKLAQSLFLVRGLTLSNE